MLSFAARRAWQAVLHTRGAWKMFQGESGQDLTVGYVRFLNCLHDAHDELSQLVQRWNAGFSLKRSLVEQYREHRLSVVQKFKCGRRFQYAEFSSADDFEGAIIKGHTASPSVDMSEGYNRHHWYQQQMFVSDVQIVQGAEGIIPSLVRLDLVEDCGDDILARNLYLSTIDGRFHFLSRLANGKLDVVGRATCTADDFAGHEIEGGSKVVQCIANDQGQAFGQWCDNAELQRVLTGSRIFLDAESVKVSLNEGVQFGIQLVDVLIGPFDLQLGSGK